MTTTTANQLQTDLGGKPKMQMLARIGIFFAGFLFFLYLLFCPLVNMPLYQFMAIHPHRLFMNTNQPVTMGLYTGEQKFFPVHNRMGKKVLLHGLNFDTFRQKRNGTLILSGGNAATVANLLYCKPGLLALNQGYDLFMYDYEGFGESEGEADYRKLGDDGVSAVKFVRDELHKSPIVLYGLSMGTGVSTYAAQRENVAGVILDSPFITPEHTIKLWFPILNIYPSWMFPEPRYDNLAFIKGKHAPALIFTMGMDGITFAEQGYRLAEMAQQPTTSVFLPASGHCWPTRGDEEKYTEAMVTFLQAVATGQYELQTSCK